MHHNITVEGHAFGLRPVSYDDADFIVSLRSDESLGRFLHKSSGNVRDQIDWLCNYYEREGDYYFVVERLFDRRREGVVSIYDIDSENCEGEWGRWILLKNSLAAIESAMLIYKVAFDKLMLSKVYCRTVANNAAVVSFHDSCGFDNKKLLQKHFMIQGERFDAIEHQITKEDWQNVLPSLERLAKMTARRVREKSD